MPGDHQARPRATAPQRQHGEEPRAQAVRVDDVAAVRQLAQPPGRDQVEPRARGGADLDGGEPRADLVEAERLLGRGRAGHQHVVARRDQTGSQRPHVLADAAGAGAEHQQHPHEATARRRSSARRSSPSSTAQPAVSSRAVTTPPAAPASSARSGPGVSSASVTHRPHRAAGTPTSSAAPSVRPSPCGTPDGGRPPIRSRAAPATSAAPATVMPAVLARPSPSSVVRGSAASGVSAPTSTSDSPAAVSQPPAVLSAAQRRAAGGEQRAAEVGDQREPDQAGGERGQRDGEGTEGPTARSAVAACVDRGEKLRHGRRRRDEHRRPGSGRQHHQPGRAGQRRRVPGGVAARGPLGQPREGGCRQRHREHGVRQHVDGLDVRVDVDRAGAAAAVGQHHGQQHDRLLGEQAGQPGGRQPAPARGHPGREAQGGPQPHTGAARRHEQRQAQHDHAERRAQREHQLGAAAPAPRSSCRAGERAP